MVRCFAAQIRQNLAGRICKPSSTGTFVVISEPVVASHSRSQPNTLIRMQVSHDHFCRRDQFAPGHGYSLSGANSYLNDETTPMSIKLERKQVNLLPCTCGESEEATP